MQGAALAAVIASVMLLLCGIKLNFIQFYPSSTLKPVGTKVKTSSTKERFLTLSMWKCFAVLLKLQLLHSTQSGFSFAGLLLCYHELQWYSQPPKNTINQRLTCSTGWISMEAFYTAALRILTQSICFWRVDFSQMFLFCVWYPRICSRAATRHQAPLPPRPPQIPSGSSGWRPIRSRLLNERRLNGAQMERAHCRQSRMWLIRTGLASTAFQTIYSADSKGHWGSAVTETLSNDRIHANRESHKIWPLTSLSLISSTLSAAFLWCG